jgi:hypothetical protein
MGMSRTAQLSVVLAILATACGTNQAATTLSTSAPTPLDVTTTTATVLTSTTVITPTTLPGSTTLPENQEDQPDQVGLSELGLVEGEQIEPPVGFDLFGEDTQGDLYELPPAARISSRLEVGAIPGVDAMIADGVEWTITYVEGFTIWDYPDGSREVLPDGGEYLYLSEDGTWQPSERFEWPPMGPAPGWWAVQSYLEGLVELGYDVVGYERLAGVDTAHLRCPDITPGFWCDFWVSNDATVVRMILDWGAYDPGEENKVWMVWDVLTFEPMEIGPLPSD